MSALRTVQNLFFKRKEDAAKGILLYEKELANILSATKLSNQKNGSNDEAVNITKTPSVDIINNFNNNLLTSEFIKSLKSELDSAKLLGHKQTEGNSLGNLGNVYANLGDMKRAISHYKQSLRIAREIGDHHGEGNSLGNLGNAYAALGETRRAIDHYEQALLIAREIGNRHGEGSHLGNLGNAYADLGEIRRAIDHYEQALLIAREIGDRRGEGNRLGNLGNAYAALGETTQAVDCLEQALAIFEAIESPNAKRVRRWLDELRGKADGG